jgi:hypothetical protein
MSTFFDTIKKSFTDVPVDAAKDNAISTTEFLEAAESLTTLFGMAGPNSPLLTPGSYPGPESTVFENWKSFADTDCSSIVDVLGSAAFKPVKGDMGGNIKKIRDRQLAAPTLSETLQDLVLNELKEKKHTATEGLVWLVRYVLFPLTISVPSLVHTFGRNDLRSCVQLHFESFSPTSGTAGRRSSPDLRAPMGGIGVSERDRFPYLHIILQTSKS